jgi:GDP-4-dehydro-6-deoxy-D-mannose reductase
VAGSFAKQVSEIELGVRTPVIEVGNVELRRDFTDVRDVARAYALAAESGGRGEVYNVASGRAHSLREMLDVMLQVSGVEAEIRVEPFLCRHGEAPLLIGDPRRLRDATGWEPTISFEQSVADTLAYWREQVRRTLVTGGNAG